MTSDERNLAIVRAIAGPDACFGINATAKGVETEEQMQRLRLEGCTEVQGYLFSEAVPASEVGTLLQDLACQNAITGI